MLDDDDRVALVDEAVKQLNEAFRYRFDGAR